MHIPLGRRQVLVGLRLTVGSRLGHSVTALVAEGGIGHVYQATDTKLNRQVGGEDPARGGRHRS